MKTLILLLAACATAFAASDGAPAAAEYARHFGPLGQLSVEVAQAMPADQYSFRPHPESMNFGELMLHIANTNYAFCAGLKDAASPSVPKPAATDKDGVVKVLADSFTYCSGVIPSLTETQLSQVHDSPDGRLPGRDILLVMYIHISHHRGQAEIYLRDKGIRPPRYRI